MGPLTSPMIRCSIGFLVAWSAFIVLYWVLGIPLGLGAADECPAGR
jgi:aminobenzoyl-glutamate transport protein